MKQHTRVPASRRAPHAHAWRWWLCCRLKKFVASLCIVSLAFSLLPNDLYLELISLPEAEAEVTIDDALNTTLYQRNPSPSVVFTSATTGYAFYVDSLTEDLVYNKTTDGGKTWDSTPTNIESTKTWINVAVWYDQWTPGDTTGTKIYIHAVEDGTDDSWFTYLDTSSDSLRGGGVVNVLQATTLAPGSSGMPSITKNADGYLFASCNFSSVPTGGLVEKSTDGGSTWVDAKPNDWSAQNTDQIQLVPLKEGGDILAIKASSGAVDYIYSRVYDESADQWDGGWTTIAPLVDNVTYLQWYSAMIKKSTGDIYLTFANNSGVAGNDLAFWKYSDASRSWTQKTDILTNDATALAPVVMIDDDMGDLYVGYLQGSLGTAMSLYEKRSVDDGASWSTPYRLSLATSNFQSVRTSAMGGDILYATWFNRGTNILYGAQVPYALHPGAEVTIDDSLFDAADEAAASPSVVFTSRDTGYAFFIDATSQDLTYRKTTDGGASWGSSTVIDTSTDWTTLAVWYDRWTPGNRTGTGINIVAIEDLTDDNWFFSLDTTDDLVTEKVASNSGLIFSEGPSGSAPSVVRGSGGALFASANFANPAGGTVAKSTNGGVSWSDVTPSSWSSAATDQIQLLPLKTDQDILAIKLDTTSDIIRSRIYDEVTDSWDSWSTIGSLTESTTYLQSYSAAVRSGSGDVFLAFQNAVATSANDLKFYHFSDATRTWTERTDVITNNDKVLGAATIVDEVTGTVYVVYHRADSAAGISSANLVYKYSTDNGVTWSAEQAPLNSTQGSFRITRGNLNTDGRLYAVWYHETNDDLFGSTIALPGARYTQGAYRFYQNDNSLDVGSVLANQDAPATLTSINQAFRLRLSLRDTDRELKQSHEELKLQYAPKSGSCSASTFQNVTSLSPITWNDNASAKDGAVFTSNANDPTYDGTERNQTYVESNAFTNSGSTIASGENGVWDFSLKDNGGYGTTYCFRIAKRDGTTFGTYSVYPEITTAGYPTISGTVYTDEGTTAMSTGRRVSISRNGGAATGSGLTRAGGFYTATLTGATLTGGTILSVYLDGATEKAVTVTLGSGSSMTGIHLYQNHLITRSDSGSVALTSAHLNIANNNGDSDITALYNTDASNNLQVSADKELYVWPGDTFSPGARVRTHDLEVLGTLNLSTNGLTVSGSLIASAGTLTTSTGITILNASSETLTLGSNPLRNLTLQASSVTLGSTLDVNGNLTIGTSSSLDVSATPYNITLSGSLINKAGTTGFTKRTGTVTLDGGDQTLSGSTIFHNLTKTVTTAKTLTMYRGYVTSVSGALTLNGTDGHLLSLRSSTNGTAARLILDGDSGTQNVSYLDVKDNNASGGSTIVCNSCTNSGNNTNWAFPISVTVYSDAGTTLIGQNKTVALSVNGGTKTTATTNASSVATFTSVSADAGSVLTFWLDNGTATGATVTVTDGNALDFVLYKNHVILQYEYGSSLTSTNLSTAYTGDSHLAGAFSMSGLNFTAGNGITTLVNAGDTLSLGGTASFDDLTVNGTLAMSTYATSILGSLDNNGTITASNTTSFIGSSSETIDTGGATLHHVTVDAPGGVYFMASALTLNGNLTITNGTLALGSQSLTLGGTYSNAGTLRLDGGNTLTGFTNDADSGTTSFSGSSIYPSLAGLSSFYHLTLEGSGTWALATNTTVAGNLSQTSGTLKDGGKTLTVAGNVTSSSTFTATGTLLLTGTNKTLTLGSNPLKNLTLQASSVTLGDDLDVNGTLTIGTSSSLDVSVAPYDITLSGSLINKAGTTGFIKQSGTVTLDGGDQTLSGSTIFHNLTKTVTTAKTLTMYKGYVTSVSGALTLNGTDGHLLSLRSSTNGTAARLILDGDNNQSVSYLDVKDNNASGGSTIVCNSCTNSGNNTNWAFPISVTVYSDAGTTLIGQNKTVALAVNGILQTTQDTNASSIAIFTSVGANAGDVLTFWLDDETENGATVTVTDGNVLNFTLYQNHLFLQAENTSTITSANLSAGFVSDTDLSDIYTMSSLNFTAGTNITTIINAGDTLSLGGTASFDDLTVNGTFGMASNAVTIRGSLDNNGTITGTANTVTFTSTASETIALNGSTMPNLEINGAGGTFTMQDALSITSNLTITNGTLALGSHSLTLGGTYSNAGTLRLDGGNTLTGFTNDADSGTTSFSGSSIYPSLAGLSSFYHLTFEGSGTWALATNTTVAGNFSQTSGTLKDGGKTLTVAGNVTSSSTFTATGTLLLTGTNKTLTLGSNPLKNLTLQASSVTLGDDLDVNGTLTIGTSSSLDVSVAPYDITLSGSLINKAGTTGFIKQSGTVTLDGGDQTLSGSTIFHNLTKTVTTAQTLTMYKGYVTSVSGALTLNGTDGHLLSLRSSTNGTAARLILDGDSGTQNVSYLDVKDNNASGGSTIVCNSCTNSGNNTNWAFPISITVYSDAGTTLIGQNKTVALAVNGVLQTTQDTNASSIAIFTSVGANAGDVLTFWLDDETENGATITVTDGNVLNFTLYQNHLFLQAENTSTITSTNLSAGFVSDTDLSDIYTMSSLNFTAGTNITTIINAGDTLSLGGTASFDDLTVNGTLGMASNAVTIRGSLDNNGTITGTANTVTFTSTASETIALNGSTMPNLEINGAGGTFTMQDALSITSNLTITNGTLALGSQSLTLGGTYSNAGTLRLDGGNTLTGFTNDADSGTTSFSGSSIYPSLAGLSSFYNLTLEGSGTWALATNTTVAGNLSQTSGTLKDGGKTLTVAGNVTSSSTFTATGTLLVTGAPSISVTSPLYHLTVNASGTASIVNNLRVNGDLSLSAGGLALTNGLTLTLSGALTKTSGQLGAGTGTVVLAGGSRTIASAFDFYNLTSTGGTRTITFAASATQTVRGALRLLGAIGETLSLRSATPGTQWRIDPQGTRTLGYLDVRDSNNTNASPILCSNNCVNSGNNTNWIFPLVVTAYSDLQGTKLGAGKTVAISVNGTTPVTEETSSDSEAIFTNVLTASGDVLTIWLDEEDERGMTVSVSDGTSLEFSVFQDQLTVQNDAGAAITNAHLATADNVSDDDVAAAYTMSGTELTMHSPFGIYVPAGKTFAPGDTVDAGDMTIRGTLRMADDDMTVRGSWNARGGTVTGENMVTFTSPTVQTITSGGNAFADIEFIIPDAGALLWTTSGALTVTGTQFVESEGGDPDITAPTISSATASTVFDTVAVIRWTTNESAYGTVVYGTASGALTSTATGVGLNLRHAVTLTGLTPDTDYFARVVARDASGNVATGSLLEFSTLEEMVPESEADAAEAAAREAGYQQGLSDGRASAQTSTTTTRSGGGGGGGRSSVTSCFTERAGAPFAMEGVNVSVEGAVATMRWTTNAHAMAVVQYGTDGEENQTTASLDPTREHSLALRQLRPNAWYSVRATSIDTCGGIVTADATFQTGEFDVIESLHAASSSGELLSGSYEEALDAALRLSQDVAPLLPSSVLEENLVRQQQALRDLARSIPGPTQLGAPRVSVTSDTATVEWSTDKPSNAVVLLSRDGSDAVDAMGNFDIGGTEHSVTLRGLQPDTSYTYRVRNTTAIGTESVSSPYGFKTQKKSGEIVRFESEVISLASARFRWTTSVETTTGITWTPYREGRPQPEESRTVSSKELSLTHERLIDDLEAGVFYDVELWGQTSAGAKIATVLRAFTTSDADVPPVIFDVSAQPAIAPGKDAKIQLAVSWMTNEASTSAVLYREGVVQDVPLDQYRRSPQDVSFSRRHTVILTNLEPGTVYSFRVQSADYGGSVTTSNVFTILTPRQQRSIFQLIATELESAFGWLQNIGL